MAQKIYFAFVLDKNLKLPRFKMQQAEVEITVTGAEDPLTHQMMRDEVSGLFKTTQSKINQMIEQTDKDLAKIGRGKADQKRKLIAGRTKSIEKQLQLFETECQSQLTLFCRKEGEKTAKLEQMASQESWFNVKWAIATLWSGGKIIADSIEAIGLTAAAPVGGPVAAAGAIKAYVDLYNDISSLYNDLWDTYAKEETLRKSIREAIKTMKAGTKVTQSSVTALADSIETYEGRLLQIEMKCKAISSKLVKSLSAIPQGSNIKPEAIAAAEENTSNLIDDITTCVKDVQTMQAALKKFKLNLGAARASAKKNSNWESMTGFAKEAYDKYNKFKDFVYNPGEAKTWIDGVLGYFTTTKGIMPSGD